MKYKHAVLYTICLYCIIRDTDAKSTKLKNKQKREHQTVN